MEIFDAFKGYIIIMGLIASYFIYYFKKRAIDRKIPVLPIKPKLPSDENGIKRYTPQERLFVLYLLIAFITFIIFLVSLEKLKTKVVDDEVTEVNKYELRQGTGENKNKWYDDKTNKVYSSDTLAYMFNTDEVVFNKQYVPDTTKVYVNIYRAKFLCFYYETSKLEASFYYKK